MHKHSAFLKKKMKNREFFSILSSEFNNFTVLSGSPIIFTCAFLATGTNLFTGKGSFRFKLS